MAHTTNPELERSVRELLHEMGSSRTRLSDHHKAQMKQLRKHCEKFKDGLLQEKLKPVNIGSIIVSHHMVLSTQFSPRLNSSTAWIALSVQYKEDLWHAGRRSSRLNANWYASKMTSVSLFQIILFALWFTLVYSPTIQSCQTR
jgi:hypothetical protein